MNNKYIPALKYNWLTKFYNPVLKYTMPELLFKSELIRQACIEEKHKILDFGIGSATLSLLIKTKNPQTSVKGVDVDPEIIRIAKKKIAKTAFDICIDQYDGLVLPYEDNSFDRVLSSLVFHHLDANQKANTLLEIKRILKPGGELHIADWGKSANIIMRGAFYFVQLLDGFKTTKDNVEGLLPKYISDSGFNEVVETKYFNTIFGTIRLIQGKK